MNAPEGTPEWQNPDQARIAGIIKESRSIAVVGLSSNPARASHGVAKYLIDKGYDVIPVNPGEQEILGRKSYPSLSAIGRPVDVVDIFRQAEATPPIVTEAIQIGAKFIY